MDQTNDAMSCNEALEHLISLAKKPLLYGSLSASRNTRTLKDGTSVKSAPYYTISHGSAKGTVSKHVPRGREEVYLNRHKNTVAFRKSVDVYIQKKSRLSDLEDALPDHKVKQTP